MDSFIYPTYNIFAECLLYVRCKMVIDMILAPVDFTETPVNLKFHCRIVLFVGKKKCIMEIKSHGWRSLVLMLWRLRGDFRLRREKWAALCSGQSPCSKILFFALGARTTLPPNTAGTLIHPRAGENTQILGTCSVGSLTARERKEPEEPWLVGRSWGITLGDSPALIPRVRRFSYPDSK